MCDLFMDIFATNCFVKQIALIYNAMYQCLCNTTSGLHILLLKNCLGRQDRRHITKKMLVLVSSDFFFLKDIWWERIFDHLNGVDGLQLIGSGAHCCDFPACGVPYCGFAVSLQPLCSSLGVSQSCTVICMVPNSSLKCVSSCRGLRF